MPKQHAWVTALAAATLSIAACGQTEQDNDPVSQGANVGEADATDSEDGGSTDAEAAEANPEDTAEVVDAPAGDTADFAFAGTTLSGESFSGEDLAGKPALLWFWAPWCPTCMAQAPAVSEIAEKYDGKINVIGVGGAATASEIEGTAKDIQGPTHLIDEPGAVWQHFKITAQSTYLILDADGTVVTDGKFLSDDELRETVAGVVG